MQAQTKSQAVAAAASDSTATLVRTMIALAATATLLFLFRPTVIHAQAASALRKPASAAPDTATRHPAPAASHGVVTGSAAGALAAQTSGKTDAAPRAALKAPLPTKSTAAKSANTGVAASHSATAPAASKSAVVAAPAASAEVTVVDPQASFSAPLADPIAASASGIWSADVATQRAARGDDQSTVFLTRTYDPVETDLAVKALLPANKSRERAGEYSGAPYAVGATALVGAGVVGRRAGSAGGSFRSVERLLLADEAEVTLPAGVTPTVGARFVSVQPSALLKSGTQVVVPTGVFEIVKVEAGRPTVARVVRQSGMVAEGQQLVPLEGTGIGTGVAAKSVPRAATAPETEVIWVEGGLIPTLQTYLVLGSGEREGVKAGDEFALVTRQGLGADAPELRVALVRVVRVTPFGASAIVVRQDAPTIAVGGAARLVARVQ